MKIDVDKLIDQVSRHPEIYNPDHKDFANKEISKNIFNNVISKEVDGINGINDKCSYIYIIFAPIITKQYRSYNIILRCCTILRIYNNIRLLFDIYAYIVILIDIYIDGDYLFI